MLATPGASSAMGRADDSFGWHTVGTGLLRIVLMIAAIGALGGGPVAPARAAWPERPITLVVAYAAGGGTDTVLRGLAAEMAAATGWRINVVNRPGAAGGLATRFVGNRPGDGYTWLGASSFNKYARISGGSGSPPWRDWYLMQATTAYGSWAVRPDSPLKTFDDVIAAARARPGELTISTSGAGGQWHELAAVVAAAAGIELRYVPYGSGQLAALAGLNGEVDIAGGGVHEHIQFVDAGQLISLQQTGPADIVTASGRIMPTLANLLPSIEGRLPPNATYNLGLRRDTPVDILQQVQNAFVAAVQSDGFRETVTVRNFAIEVVTGEAADRRAAEFETVSAATFQRLGIPGSRNADELGLPKPADFDRWWPPAGYEPLPLSAP
jgi:tripartite-type tricarboxylate transporter receptor subunit TctC